MPAPGGAGPGRDATEPGARRTGLGSDRSGRRTCQASAANPQHRDHRPHRPRQVDAVADRMLEITGAVDPRDHPREMTCEQYLDSMDLERERGITIKLQSVRSTGTDHVINLIDTPGHVDFGYEVSGRWRRARAWSCSSTPPRASRPRRWPTATWPSSTTSRSSPASTRSTCPPPTPTSTPRRSRTCSASPPRTSCASRPRPARACPSCSTRSSSDPRPVGDADAPLQALIFDSHFDQYRGVVSSVRVINGTCAPRRQAALHAGRGTDPRGRRDRGPPPTPPRSTRSGPGEVGYLIAGIKDVGEARSGETVTTASNGPTEPLPGYQDPKPMVFCGLYPIDGDDFSDLRDALEKLRLNDSSFTYEPETSGALGFGFRCGFLGPAAHGDRPERLEREFDLSLIATAPSVEYRVTQDRRRRRRGSTTPSELPPPARSRASRSRLQGHDPHPTEYTGTVMELCQSRRGEMQKMEYLSPERVELVYEIPLAEVVIDFFDQLKSRTQGYASLDYEPAGYQPGQPGQGRHPAQRRAGRRVQHDRAPRQRLRVRPSMCEKLKELIPRQMFDVPIQAAIGGKDHRRETVKAKRKDVLAKCYGGDITRKRKLLEKQKEGKKRMKSIGGSRCPSPPHHPARVVHAGEQHGRDHRRRRGRGGVRAGRHGARARQPLRRQPV
jgi:GTP-binding protein LepA